MWFMIYITHEDIWLSRISGPREYLASKIFAVRSYLASMIGTGDVWLLEMSGSQAHLLSNIFKYLGNFPTFISGTRSTHSFKTHINSVNFSPLILTAHTALHSTPIEYAYYFYKC